MIHFTWVSVLYILIGLIGINVLVIIHELGHYFACRACNVQVESLSIGLGPKLKKWEKNGTSYIIRAIPFGGATKMLGQDDLKAALRRGDKQIKNCEEGSLFAASPLKKIFIYASGPVANIILALFCFTLLSCMTSINLFIPPKIVLSSDYPLLFSQPCPAKQAGLRTGDIIRYVNDKKIYSFSELSNILKQNKDSTVKLTTQDNRTIYVKSENSTYGILPFRDTVVSHVEANSNEKLSGLKPNDIIIRANSRPVGNMFDILEEAQEKDTLTLAVLRNNILHIVSFNTDGKLNFSLQNQTTKQKGESFFTSLSKAIRECLYETRQFFNSIIALFEKKNKLSQTIGGTIYASENMGMLTSKGFSSSFNIGIRVLLYVTASLSLSLAVANFLPITALDGGLILISFAELVCGRTLSPKMYIFLQIVGLLVIFIIIPITRLFY